MKLLTILLAFCCMAIQSAEEDEALNSVRVSIRGTGAGGEVVLAFPSRVLASADSTAPVVLPTTITINTAAGESDIDIARRLSTRFEELSGSIFSVQARGNDLYFQPYSLGEIGLTSTDTGITTYSAVQNVTATKTVDNFVTVSWTLPPNVVFDVVYVYRGHVAVGVVTDAQTTSIVDKTARSNDFPTEDSTPAKPTLEYRIIGVKNGIPSSPAAVTIPNPVANP